MTHHRSLAVLSFLALASTAGAQTAAAPCAAEPTFVQDACQKAADVFAFLAPQLGASLAGGGAVLGQTSTLGGFPKFSIGLRVNALRGALPQPQGVTLSLNGRQATAFRTENQWVGLPTAEGAVGLFAGIPLGFTNVLGVDALVSATYLPSVDDDDFGVRTSGGGLQLGYGARLGILQETAIVPGVSATYLRRQLPTTNVVARVGVDSVLVDDVDAKTDSWRLQAGKRFAIIGVNAGVGQDRYDSRARAGVILNRTIPVLGQARLEDRDVASVRQELTRTNLFAGASLNFPIVRFSAEIGRVSGGEVPATFNSFGGRAPDDAYTYGAVGLRVQF
ncbi:hypothetical protein [Roseisolibacter sp. H3M3-2]|uniref:hypothetical protein n=1 Tax=Roseisolibacter sp. H3M3-2 TaxID=3031323 RepID=UPI0023DA3EFD|nr:hypothetical protein [Roseisolibacter sp. H3M3-2]MDF1503333.1 hypothetical protein [Roseisolibacter sp. H3M3-2]